MKEHPREKEEVLTHLARSAGTGYKNNTTPPGRRTSQLPCLISNLQQQSWLAGWQGWEEMAGSQTTG